MGDGWAYTYGAHTICGFKQTHQPSPWINDYGQFLPDARARQGQNRRREPPQLVLAPVRGGAALLLQVYLADHDVVAEIAPTDRAAAMRFTFPESEESGIVVDAFDRGSRRRGDARRPHRRGLHHPQQRRCTRQFPQLLRGTVRQAVRRFPRLQRQKELKGSEAKGDHALAAVYFATRRGEQVTARVASSFISPEQALRTPRIGGRRRRFRDRQGQSTRALGRSAGPHRGRAAAPRSSTARSTRVSTVRPYSPQVLRNRRRG